MPRINKKPETGYSAKEVDKLMEVGKQVGFYAGWLAARSPESVGDAWKDWREQEEKKREALKGGME